MAPAVLLVFVVFGALSFFLHEEVVFRLRGAGREHEFEELRGFWTPTRLLPLRQVWQLRGSIEDSDWYLVLAYCTTSLITVGAIGVMFAPMFI